MSILGLFVWLILIAGGAALAYWANDQIGAPDPIGRIIRVVIVVIACLMIAWVCLAALGMSGGPSGILKPM